jgi:small-conductance mechanosensitive channel
MLIKPGAISNELDARKQQDIQHTLQQITPKHRHFPAQTLRHSWLSLLIYTLLIVVLGSTYFLSKFQFFEAGATYKSYSERILLCSLLVITLLTAEKLIRIHLIGKLQDDVSRYNVAQLVRFVIWTAICAVTLSTLLSSWTTALFSLGLMSLVLGLALQAPLTNLFSWLYILIRKPYRIGDRIKMGNASGDVIHVGFFDTTLWEFGGQYLSTDHPSGRVIQFPNSLVLSNPVYNYSWPLFPYLWSEIKFYVAYQSDLEFVAETMRAIAQDEIGVDMRQHVAAYRELLAKTPVDAIEVTEEPVVLFRSSDNGHVEAIVRYLVAPKQEGKIKSALTRKMLTKLNEQPERVLFPKP